MYLCHWSSIFKLYPSFNCIITLFKKKKKKKLGLRRRTIKSWPSHFFGWRILWSLWISLIVEKSLLNDFFWEYRIGYLRIKEKKIKKKWRRWWIFWSQSQIRSSNWEIGSVNFARSAAILNAKSEVIILFYFILFLLKIKKRKTQPQFYFSLIFIASYLDSTLSWIWIDGYY